MTVIQLQERNSHNTEVLFSYETPVAAYTLNKGWIQTDRKYSRTTTKHINQWAGKYAKKVPQQVLDNLIEVTTINKGELI